VSGYQAAMPGHQRGRGDNEDGPASAGKDTTRRGEERPIRISQLETYDLAAQHGELVPQHHDLQLLERTSPEAQHDQLEKPPRE